MLHKKFHKNWTNNRKEILKLLRSSPQAERDIQAAISGKTWKRVKKVIQSQPNFFRQNKTNLNRWSKVLTNIREMMIVHMEEYLEWSKKNL